MTPEETVNQYYWWVLSKIKVESLTTLKDQPIRYKLSHLVAAGVPGNQTEKNILLKLAEDRVLRVRDDPFEPPFERHPSPGVYYLDLLQPKYNEIYKKYQQACDLQSHLNTIQEKVYDNLNDKKDKDSNLPKFLHVKADKKTQDYEKEIDEWLKTKNEWVLAKIWKVVSSLNSEWQLRDQETFNIPHDKFQRNKIESKEDLSAILTNLQNKKFLLVMKKVGQTSRSADPSKPQASLWATIIDKPEIINDPLTQVELKPQRFGYLVIALKTRVHPEKTQGQNISQQLTQATEIQWLEKLHWGNSKEFVLGKKGSINFGTDSSDRIKIFKMLTEAKGNWVAVKDMAKTIDTPEGQLRVIIGQINNEYLQSTIIEIVARDDKNELGAYRINIMIPLDKL